MPPQIQLRTIPNARALILDDQPKPADDAIATFLEHVQEVRRKTELKDTNLTPPRVR